MPYETYKKIALVGATGNLGAVVLQELLASNLFEITVLSRISSTSTGPPGVKFIKVDFDSLDSLVAALEGQDALVSTVASLAVSAQKRLIDAAVKARVKRIIPSEFGCDLHNVKTRGLPVYAAKVEIEKYLDELAVKGLVSYTLVYTGPFLDWGLRKGTFFNFKDRKADLYDGGDQLFSTSRLSTIGKAVRRILTHPPETADRAVWVKDIDVSQKHLLKLAQALTPGEEWEVKEVATAELEKQALEEVETKKIGPTTMLNLLRRAIYAPEYGNKFEHVHNSVLGIRGMTEPDLEELVLSIFGTK
ncbi:Isoflavone reductase-like protein [Lachnellula willkommii]|uniref:Isoflavone reductase-like protein n=1 Tax=Lachnellula willkommii TaxID=215461 RepID=A0A559MFI2_9HELO|nr:Isoflavone reductase-like protein [Lachnellula willkommii]